MNKQYQRISKGLAEHSQNIQPLPGIQKSCYLDAFTLQIIASIRREDYYKKIQKLPISPRREDPHDSLFDPEHAIAYHMANGNSEEAMWLVFLVTHFGKHAVYHWRRLQDVYGKLGSNRWDWYTVSGNPARFEEWLNKNWKEVKGRFGSHRKCESLRPEAKGTTGFVVREYVRIIGKVGQLGYIQSILANKPEGHDHFDKLYRALNFPRFGRLAKFDYLMLLARFNIVRMSPRSAYLPHSGGPIRGANLLFTESKCSGMSPGELQKMLDDLDKHLQVGMSVLEDALCNWQKEPSKFVPPCHYEAQCNAGDT